MTEDNKPKSRRRAQPSTPDAAVPRRPRRQPESAAPASAAAITPAAVAAPAAPAPTPAAPERPRMFGRRIRNILVGLAITIAISAVAERATDAEWLERALVVQADWMAAVEKTQPLAVAGSYWTELVEAFNRPGSASLAVPFLALWKTVEDLWTSSGITGLVQIGLAALVLAVFNLERSNGSTVMFGDALPSMVGMPLAIIALASLAGLILWGLMWGSLWLLSGLTSIGALLAGVSGVGGACYYCVTELTKKSVENVLTPKL